MVESNAWFAARIDEFRSSPAGEPRQSYLAEFKIKFHALGAEEARNVVKRLDLEKLWKEFESDDDEVTETCSLIELLLEALKPEEILTNYVAELEKLLSSRVVAPRVLSLEQILKVASDTNGLPLLLARVNLLNSVTQRIGDAELKVANLAMNVIKRVGKAPEGPKLLYSGVIMRSIAKLLSVDPTVRFRVYEVIIEVAKSSKEALAASVESGFMESLIDSINSDDVLIKLNVIELIIPLALTEDGYKYLNERGFVSQMANQIEHAKESPLDALFIPGLIKFFGCTARSNPYEIFAKYPVAVLSLFDLIAGNDMSILPIALDTLGYISETVQSKYALQDLKVMPMAMKKIGELMQNSTAEVKISACSNLAKILHVDKSEQDNRIVTLTKSWFDALGEDPLKLVVDISRLPFNDLRNAAYEVLVEIASQQWGQESIVNYPGLVEFLLDRRNETCKQCKETKYAMIKNLSESDVIDSSTLDSLKTYVQEGAFYKGSDIDYEVNFEGAS
ncbi:hypothetical protein TKK_0003790 [Trichogramma kaykai]|uniref:26S proteasome non-ATPase regulatory subunit 5 n=1 Tax=Trichogramma kaykai TaxID=54128 RepID=A0ABD2XPF9_9HYME